MDGTIDNRHHSASQEKEGDMDRKPTPSPSLYMHPPDCPALPCHALPASTVPTAATSLGPHRTTRHQTGPSIRFQTEHFEPWSEGSRGQSCGKFEINMNPRRTTLPPGTFGDGLRGNRPFKPRGALKLSLQKSSPSSADLFLDTFISQSRPKESVRVRVRVALL
ncbi:hypothetical protein E4U54_002445 [Claviceps lovelessii]|nr:hypothetical protein E4U54_002445 [Claviceps lovelessii]